MTTTENVLMSILVGGPIVGNTVIMVLRAVGKPEWADRVAQATPLVFKAVKIAEDVIEAPSDKRFDVFLDDLDKVTSVDDAKAIAVRMRAALK